MVTIHRYSLFPILVVWVAKRVTLYVIAMAMGIAIAIAIVNAIIIFILIINVWDAVSVTSYWRRLLTRAIPD